mgnify:CR=1 FL=1
MAAKKKKVTAQKVKKKRWFPIFAPQLFASAPLGERGVADSSLLSGKYITANLSTITRSMRKQNVNMHFRIVKVEDDKAQTEAIGYSLINAAMKRLVRRGRDKIADSFLAKTKDKRVMRIKPLIITTTKGTHSAQTAIRLEARRVIREYVFAKSVEELLSDIAEGKLQKIIKESCVKIAPLRSVDIRRAVLVENIDVVITEDGVKTEAVTIRKKQKGEDLRTEEEKKVRQLPDDQFADDSSRDENEHDARGESTEDFGDEVEEGDRPDEEVDEYGEQSADELVDAPAKKRPVTLEQEPPGDDAEPEADFDEDEQAKDSPVDKDELPQPSDQEPEKKK